MIKMKPDIKELFRLPTAIRGNAIFAGGFDVEATNQKQTQDIFSDKWMEVEKLQDVEKMYNTQFEWFLQLYGFNSEKQLAAYLDGKVVVDAGCGLGYKAAWFAKLAPTCTVIGIDISDAILLASKNFNDLDNLYFMQGNIAETLFSNNVVDFVVCDQVIMHTESPEETFKHLSDITKPGGCFACYVYRKKALPRELLDDYFRLQTHNIPKEEMWEFSSQLTELGKSLSELKISFESPDIPLLGIKGGTYDVQRFIYWNFIKCFWKEEWGFELSKSTNYDWYAPSNAKRFSKEEFMQLIQANHLNVVFFHEEEACYSGRFEKVS